MTTVAILPVSDTNGERLYRAITGDKQSTGKTAGEALDALTAQLEGSESDTEVRLFHPRQDQWENHFQVDSDSGTLAAKTPIGRVTISGARDEQSSTSNGAAAMDSFRLVSLKLPISSSTVASDRKTTQTDNNIQENFPGCWLSRT